MGKARAADPDLELDDPAPDPEPDPAPDPEPEKPETVPVAALVEERRKYQSKIDDLTGRLDRLAPLADELVRMRQERQKPPEPEKPKAPDYLEDPKGYVDNLNAALVSDLRKAQEQLGHAERTVQQNQMVTAVQAQLSAFEAPFTKEHPDYWQALDHLRDSRRSHFKALFPDASDADIETTVKEEEFRTATLLLQRRQNPIERAYELAKTMGYKPPEAEKNQDKANAGGLGASSGQSVNSELERMMSSTDDEFDKAFAALFGKR